MNVGQFTHNSSNSDLDDQDPDPSDTSLGLIAHSRTTGCQEHFCCHGDWYGSVCRLRYLL